MGSANQIEPLENESEHQRPRKLALFRIIRAFKRRGGHLPGGDEEHAQNERTMAKWTRRLGVFTIILAICAVLNVIVIYFQLREMQSGGIDTRHLVEAAQAQAASMSSLAGAARDQATATDNLEQAAVDESTAAKAEATAMDRLRQAGETQASSMEHLRSAGDAQATATRDLAKESAGQLAAIKEEAAAALVQSKAVQMQADATIAASKATDRLASAGQAQSNAMLQSLGVARAANDIASRASAAADRPWIRISMPQDVEPVVGQDYIVVVDISNVGRSPAVDATASVDIRIISAAENFVGVIDPCKGAGCQRYTVFPSAAGFQNLGFTYKPKILAKEMTVDEIGRLAAKTDAILVRVRIDYTDSSGAQHLSNSCYFLIPKFGFTSCNVGNVAN